MTTSNARFNNQSRIIVPGEKNPDIKLVITFNSITKATELYVEKGTINQYGMMTLCLQHAATLNANINMVSAPQGQTMQEKGGTDGTA